MKNIEWDKFPDLRAGMIRFLDSVGDVHDCLLAGEERVFDSDPLAIIVARTPEEWREFQAQQIQIDELWALRNFVTTEDHKFLRACGIVWERRMIAARTVAIPHAHAAPC